jgi:transcription-repair coupling factor (superfamily II helicase)
LLAAYSESERVKDLAGKLIPSPIKLHLRGLVGSARSVIIAALQAQSPRTHLIILNELEDAGYIYSDFYNLFDGRNVHFFPPSYKRPYHINALENNQVLERAEVLNRLKQKADSGDIVVTTYEALAEKVITEVELVKNTYELKVGNTFDLEFFIDFLTEHHFERSDFVYEAGQFSIRGGIIDVFSFSNEEPYRMELNGDEIESIRTFDTVNQLSNKRVDRLYIIPNVQKQDDENGRQPFFNYLPDNAVIWTDNIDLGLQHVKKGLEKAAEIYSKHQAVHDEDKLQPVDQLFINADKIEQALNAMRVVESAAHTHFASDAVIAFNTNPQPVFHKNFKMLIENLKNNQTLQLTNLIFSDSARQIERLYTIFEDLDKEVGFQPIYHAITKGFIDKDLKLACYTEHQVFDRFYRGRTKSVNNKSRIITLKELRDLKPGDFVTHIDHGIGRFAGLEKIEINGHMQEAVRLVYRDNDLLYVSINSLHKISKFVGKDGTEPRVHKLGSDVWEKLKNNTKKKVKDIARDLIKLYAKRKAQEGFQFSPDNYLQVELEASFMYEDTPDQSKATADVKADMETAHPMDRLVCGDVGFGKTEVAIRSAFKAVCDSKQVAVLVPTTILANQHYRTFKERLKDFPCNIDYINRFKSAAEQKNILQKAKEGKIDILIGTHKLLSKELKFKDLGLLIIDEEQKFGVAAKEKLKA